MLASKKELVVTKLVAKQKVKERVAKLSSEDTISTRDLLDLCTLNMLLEACDDKLKDFDD